ncbi:MAG: lytic transglycosylase domain-containing protein [Nitrospirae bacterium]|nr:lytic transglycosylase domain-containing protein [Candidatus Manganitrophaceae bacterium]
MRVFGVFGLLSFLFALPFCAQASEIYQYIDAAGTIHFTNVPTDSRFKRMDQGEAKAVLPDKIDRDILNILIYEASKTHKISPALTMAVIRTESNFNPRAVSVAGAQGLMQIMPATAGDLRINDPFDPEENIHGGTRYLRYLLDRFDQNLTLALAAYHAGPGTVSRYGGVPPIKQTKRYIKKVLHFYDYYLNETKRSEIKKRDTKGEEAKLPAQPMPGPALAQNIPSQSKIKIPNH